MACTRWFCSASRDAARTTAGALCSIGARSIRPCTGLSRSGCSVEEAVTTSGSTREARSSATTATVRTARTLGPTWGRWLESHQPGPLVLDAASWACPWALASVAVAPAWSPLASWPLSVSKSAATACSAVRARSACRPV